MSYKWLNCAVSSPGNWLQFSCLIIGCCNQPMIEFNRFSQQKKIATKNGTKQYVLNNFLIVDIYYYTSIHYGHVIVPFGVKSLNNQNLNCQHRFTIFWLHKINDISATKIAINKL